MPPSSQERMSELNAENEFSNVITVDRRMPRDEEVRKTIEAKPLAFSSSEIAVDRTQEITDWERATKKSLQFPKNKILDINGQFESLGLDIYDSFTPEEEFMLSLWGDGYTMNQVCRYMKAAFGMSIRNQDIIQTSNKLMPLIQLWRQRPLERVYSTLYLDAKYYDVKSNGRNSGMTGYSILGISSTGRKSLLGLWIDDKKESASHWLQILIELEARNVQDSIFCCMDGLTGLADAVKVRFKETNVQLCLFHQIHETLLGVAVKDRQKIAAELKSIYLAQSHEMGLLALKTMKERWPNYHSVFLPWEVHWSKLATCYDLPMVLRKIIYTNNPMENVNSQFGRTTDSVLVFPDTDTLYKRLWLSQLFTSRRWRQPMSYWNEARAYISILYPNRLEALG